MRGKFFFGAFICASKRFAAPMADSCARRSTDGTASVLPFSKALTLLYSNASGFSSYRAIITCSIVRASGFTLFARRQSVEPFLTVNILFLTFVDEAGTVGPSLAAILMSGVCEPNLESACVVNTGLIAICTETGIDTGPLGVNTSMSVVRSDLFHAVAVRMTR